jgi:hypothetical protein
MWLARIVNDSQKGNAHISGRRLYHTYKKIKGEIKSNKPSAKQIVNHHCVKITSTASFD